MHAAVFLFMVFMISFTGALSPGPMTFATLVKGTEDPWAGVKVTLGHALMEIPLIVAIYLGLLALVNEPTLRIIGIVGGIVLLIMGGQMLLQRNESRKEEETGGSGAVRLGILTSVGNPYAWIWWLTVGTALIAQALGFGIWMLPLFIVAHLSTDFLWMGLLGFGTFRSRALLSDSWMTRIVAGGGLLLMMFGLYFLGSSLQGFSL